MNKTTLLSVLIFFSTGFIMGAMLRGCRGGWVRGTVAPVHSDTVTRLIPRRDTIWREMRVPRTIPVAVYGRDSIVVTQTERVCGRDTTPLTLYTYHSDTAVYSDTLRLSGAWQAAIADTLADNRIIGRSVRWADLSPIEQRTITTTLIKKSPLLSAYLGVNAYAGATGLTYDLDLAPAGSFVIADRYMVDLGYYILHRQLTAGVKVKLNFRK